MAAEVALRVAGFLRCARADDVERCGTVPSAGCRSPKYAGGNHGGAGACGLRPPDPRLASAVALGASRCLRGLRGGRLSDSALRAAVGPEARALSGLAALFGL